MPASTVVKYPQGFTCVDNRVLKSPIFRSSKPMTRLIYLYVAQYRNNNTGIAFPSQETIAADMGVSESSVKRGINELVKLGLLDKHRLPGKRHNTYVFRYDGVENDRAVDQEFEYPAEPEPAEVEVEATPEPVATQLTLISSPKSRGKRRKVDLKTVDECKTRLESRDYWGLTEPEIALAVFYDHYAAYNGITFPIPSWPEALSHAKRLFKFRNGDLESIIKWVKMGFECASQKEICFKDGALGMTVSALMQSYNATIINAWLATPEPTGERAYSGGV